VTAARHAAGVDGRPEAGWVQRLDRQLDRLPRAVFHLGAREVPAFRSLGVLGFHLGVLTALLTAARAGVPALDAASLSAVAGVSFFAWGLLRRAVTGRESLVLLEHVLVAFGAVALLRLTSGAPVLPGWDVLAVGLCPFLALGRIGCLTVGCCHGQPAAVGIVYPRSAVPDRLAGVRLFPLPLVEAVALLAIGGAAFVLAGGQPGQATVWMLAAYATVRFGTEALRGDRRPTVAGVSVPRTMCVAVLAGALTLDELTGPQDDGRRLVVGAAVLGAVTVAGAVLARRRRDSLTAPDHLDETWDRIRSLARTAPTEGYPTVPVATSAGLRLTATWGEYGLHVSFSHPARPVQAVPLALGLTPLAQTGSATHVVVPAGRLPHRPPKTDPHGSGGGYHPDGDRRVPDMETYFRA
jgi:hypothetical protein